MSFSTIFPLGNAYDVQFSTIINKKMRVPEHIFSNPVNNEFQISNLKYLQKMEDHRETRSEIIDLFMHPKGDLSQSENFLKSKQNIKKKCKCSRTTMSEPNNTSSLVSEMAGVSSTSTSAGSGSSSRDVATETAVAPPVLQPICVHHHTSPDTAKPTVTTHESQYELRRLSQRLSQAEKSLRRLELAQTQLRGGLTFLSLLGVIGVVTVSCCCRDVISKPHSLFSH